MNRPLFSSGIIGLGVILSGLIVLIFLPKNAVSLVDGFITPVLAFEFIQSMNEVYDIFGREPSPERLAMITSMTRGNQLDFAFMGFYTLFLITFFAKCVKIARSRVYLAGIVLAILVLIGDILENVCLLNILSNLDAGDFSAYVFWLGWFTWLKWGGLAIIALLLVPFLVEANRFSRFIALWALGVAGLGIAAFLNRGFLNELFSWFVTCLFLGLIVFSFTYRRMRRILI